MSKRSLTDFPGGVNADYLSHLYSLYLSSPEKVDSSWKSFFEDLGEDESSLLKEIGGASWTPEENRKDVTSAIAGGRTAASPQEDSRSAALDSLRALMLIRSYRFRGHMIANLDPLGLMEHERQPELDPSHFGFVGDDFGRPIFINGALGLETATLGEILSALQEVYCSSIGVEYMHIADLEERKWIQARIENTRNRTDFTINGKRAILQRITAAEVFENFLHKKYPGTKRFGIDGGEVLIPAIEQIMKRGGQLGLKEIVIGMSHRGRLNVLTNVMGKPFTAVFAEFQGQDNPEAVQGSGDVKYHLGTSSDRDFDGNTVHLSLTANPSHLESVNPVVIGKVRAKQLQRRDESRREVLPLLLHGDAAFAGQGIAAETLMISDLPGYRVGGTIHIVVNNQIGFTTTPKHGRSGPYPTDVAKMLAAPIFHVNGDDPEAVIHIARIATEFRQKFGKDVVIDIFCYRRYGHNEGDEPSFTQPLMYQRISRQPTTRSQYANRLLSEKVATEEEIQAMADEVYRQLDDAYNSTGSYRPNASDNFGGRWQGFKRAYGDDWRGNTAITDEQASRIGKVLTTVPEDFHLHPKLEKFMESRREMFETGQGFDWSAAEALAFGSLIDDGFGVRLSGQDCGRGTFSQRHAILHDQEDGSRYRSLEHVRDDQPVFEVHNSPLSEAAVLGFEYGFSLSEPNTLVLWEAQFGDFANVAQAIIDQYISSAEAKWARMSGLVMLLPHGQEGQGPEHSSARLERFLQLCGDDNWQICNCTTPANYFHVLRRQMCRDFRKPLVLMTPKSLLRHKLCVSALSDMTGNSGFHRYLDDDDAALLERPDRIRRIVCCSGKVYYDLLQERRARDIRDILLLRIEQLYPFPMKAVSEKLALHPDAEIVWCQEEPRNQGAWFYMGQRFEDSLEAIGHKYRRARYIGRPEMSAPATGSYKRFVEEQAAIVNEALSL